jgi:glycosyltransferase involved in cell wall biosynthesis
MNEEAGRDTMSGQVLQIVPNDHPPFGDITATYTRALASLGLETRTLFLSPPRRAAIDGAEYLSLDDLGRVRDAGRTLRRALGDTSFVLAICHRYRSYRVFRASGVYVPRFVTVAHEFGLFQRVQRRLGRRLFGRDVLFAGVSPAVTAELGAAVPDPVCIPNAIDLEGFDENRLERLEALAALGVSSSPEFTVGLLGRLVEKKQPELALDAVRALVQKPLPVRLLVIGDGPLRQDLESMASDLPVTFCGFVPDARYLLGALDALVITSLDVEAFGMVALEAMASGVPVVSGPAPGPQFVLGGSGYYYTQREPGEVAAALERVYRDRQTGAMAERMERARERVIREFSIAALASRLDDLFFRV